MKFSILRHKKCFYNCYHNFCYFYCGKTVGTFSVDNLGTMLKSSSSESSVKFVCELCNYKSCRESQYNRHLSTVKHKQVSESTNFQQLSTDFNIKSSACFSCICGKIYKERTGLWRHKRNCDFKDIKKENKIHEEEDVKVEEIKETILADKELILMLIKQNAELLEIVKNGTHNNSHNTNNHSHNKTFNLQFFLNETCKDAMNIMDFVDSIKYKICDLEKMGEIGYVEGLSNIITSNLNALDVTKRPIHCADKKREVIYIKDDDKWEKEEEDKKRLRKIIKKVAYKNTKLLPYYKETHPECDGTNSEQYNKMIIEAMGGLGNDDKEKEDKIIRNISKNIVIDKSTI